MPKRRKRKYMPSEVACPHCHKWIDSLYCDAVESNDGGEEVRSGQCPWCDEVVFAAFVQVIVRAWKP